MQNVDRYRTELLEEFERRKLEIKDIDGYCFDIVDVYIDGIEAVKIRHNGGHSKFFSDSFEWLFSEWKPSLLKNGDKLKAGDWVMVKNSGDTIWRKRQFLCMYDDMFIVSGEGAHLPHGMHSGWEQACLPEEDEWQ